MPRCDVDDGFATLYRRAIGYLVRREYSHAELARKIGTRCNDSALIEKVLTRLQQDSYLSDTRFVESYIRNRLRKAYGPMRISHELRTRGVDEALINQGIASIDDWLSHARKAYQRKYGDSTEQTNNSLDNTSEHTLEDTLKRKRYLHDRGFGADIINQILDHARH